MIFVKQCYKHTHIIVFKEIPRFILQVANLVTSSYFFFSSSGHITQDDATEKPLPFILVMWLVSLAFFLAFFLGKYLLRHFLRLRKPRPMPALMLSYNGTHQSGPLRCQIDLKLALKYTFFYLTILVGHRLSHTCAIDYN